MHNKSSLEGIIKGYSTPEHPRYGLGFLNQRESEEKGRGRRKTRKSKHGKSYAARE